MLQWATGTQYDFQFIRIPIFDTAFQNSQLCSVEYVDQDSSKRFYFDRAIKGEYRENAFQDIFSTVNSMMIVKLEFNFCGDDSKICKPHRRRISYYGSERIKEMLVFPGSDPSIDYLLVATETTIQLVKGQGRYYRTLQK